MMRTCVQCGQPLSPTARFCTVCGREAPELTHDPAVEPVMAGGVQPASPPVAGWAPPPGMVAVPAGWSLQPAQRSVGMATSSMVMGILSWVLLFLFIGVFTGFITAPLAIGLGVAARARIESEPERWKGGGSATAGFWLGMSWMLVATAVVSAIVAVRLFG